jgi:cyclopropane-fatty-acyl-phospholipid synthase
MVARALLRRFFSTCSLAEDSRVSFVFADGSRVERGRGEAEATVMFHSGGAEWNTLLFGHIGLLESYFAGTIDIEGDLRAFLKAGFRSDFTRPNPLVAVRNRWHESRFSNRSLSQAKANARFHYGLGTEFFRYWLDRPAMMYTCAYWKEGTRDLEEAQRNKIDHVCRKLLLQPGERVADIGCGWGGFMFHAERHYGVTATGYNATTEQVVALREEIARQGLADKLEVLERDFREVDGQFDKVAHIGVLEHAGRDQLDDGIRALAACLRPGGLGVLHYIGHVRRYNTEFFIRKHIFPGGWIPSLTETLDLMEKHGLEILDVENLRRHYAPTLDAWAGRFDRHWEDIQRLDPDRFDETFRRKWRIYLYACAEMFRSPKGYTHLFQITFSKGNVDYAYPMSRSHLYAINPSWPATESRS